MNKTWKYIAVLLGIFLFHLVANYQVLTKSQIPRIYDEENRIRNGLFNYETLFLKSNISFQRKIILITRLTGQGHPPLSDIMGAFAWKLLSMMKRMDVELMILTTNAFFLAVLLLSVFGIGTLLYNRNVGLLAALLTPLFPSMFGFSRTTLLDFPLSCMVAASFFLLLKTNGFSSRIYSVLFGAVAGFSVLTKEAAVLFLIAPVSFYFIKAYLSGYRRQVIFNMLAALLCFFPVVGIFFFQPDHVQVFGLYFKQIGINPAGTRTFYDMQKLTALVGPWLLALGVPLLIKYFMHFEKRDWFLLFWCLIPILLFSAAPSKQMRFMLPIVPALALILARTAMANNWPKAIERVYVFLLITLSFAQYSFYHTGYLKGINPPYSSTQIEGVLSITREDDYLRVAAKLFDVFKNETPHFGMKKILFLFNVGKIQGPLAIKLMMTPLGFQVRSPLIMDAANFASYYPTCSEEILGADYVLDMVGSARRDLNAATRQFENCLIKEFAEHKDDFKNIAAGIPYDRSLIYVYKRIRR